MKAQDPQKEWEFFIAHAGADISAAEALYELLVRDHTTFLDTRSISPGTDWAKELLQAQRQSLVTVLLVSPNTADAYYQREEISNAIQLSRDQTRLHYVVPVYLDSDPDSEVEIPYGLRLMQSIRLSQVGGFSGVVKELSKLLIEIRQSSLGSNVVVDDERESASTANDIAALKSSPLSGVIVVREDRVCDIWKACLNEVLHPDSTVRRLTPVELRNESALLDLLAERHDFIMLPLTLNDYNSIRLAEHAHRLNSPSRVILCSSTNAPRDALDGLFDSYVPTREFSVQTIAEAIAKSVTRSILFAELERRIEVVLSTATCFIIRAQTYHEPDRPSTLKDYHSGRVP